MYRTGYNMANTTALKEAGVPRGEPHSGSLLKIPINNFKLEEELYKEYVKEKEAMFCKERNAKARAKYYEKIKDPEERKKENQRIKDTRDRLR